MMHIVHIEEDRPLSDMLRMAFETIEPGLTLKQFTCVNSALPYIQQHQDSIDLFIVDMRLSGGIDGLSLAKKLREENYPGYIVLTSDYGAPSDSILDALKVEFVPSPWHIIDLTPRLLQYRIRKNGNPPFSAHALL